MIKSMTGFGQASAEADGVTVWAEISSLNHRYLDIGVKLPSPLSLLENEVKKVVQNYFERGRVNVLLTLEGTLPEATQVEFDESLARQYVDTVREFGRRAVLKDDLSTTAILRLGQVWNPKRPREEDVGKLWALTQKALTRGIERLLEMRVTEGANLWADLLGKLEEVNCVTAEIAERAPSVVEEYRRKLRERIALILPLGTEPDEQRLVTEVAVFADRADISEELVRMRSHAEQFKMLAQQDSNVGRRLDFLLQEMFREITTIGSKARDTQIAHGVVEVKGLLEKMREQVQNVE